MSLGRRGAGVHLALKERLALNRVPNKIKVKIADVEFEAEGSPDVVQAQYDKFLEMIDKMTELRKIETGFDPKKSRG